MKRIAVGMSGGVDSSVVAALLVEQGYKVTGVFIEAYNEPGCRTDEDKRDALRVAAQLGIEFRVLDVRDEYKKLVVKNFFDEYEAGRTPNPDVVCNREVKFGIFLDWALRPAQGKPGFDYVATGHYSRVVQTRIQNSEFIKREILLQRPRDLSKDQTYFLWQVIPEKLENIIFPLGDMLKSEVRELAKKYGFANADKPDSMGVCMMGELNVAQFLKNKLGEKEGEVVMISRKSVNPYISVGTHKGLWFYTIGQRVGGEILNHLNKKALNQLGIDNTKLPTLYVVGKDQANNALIIGEREECNISEFRIQNLEFRIKQKEIDDLIEQQKLFVRIRNLGELVGVIKLQDGVVKLSEQIFAPAPGQSAVFYSEDGTLVGGGLIV